MNIALLRQETPISVRIAQVAGITTAAFLAGQNASTTYLVTPSLLQAPAPLLARQWRTLWLRTRATAPVLTAGLAGTFGWLSYRAPSSTALKLYGAATVLIFTIFPYTTLVMGSYNSKLLEKADTLASTSLEDTAAEAGVALEETVHSLVDKWATLNLGSALIIGTAAISAAWASLSPLELM